MLLLCHLGLSFAPRLKSRCAAVFTKPCICNRDRDRARIPLFSRPPILLYLTPSHAEPGESFSLECSPLPALPSPVCPTELPAAFRSQCRCHFLQEALPILTLPLSSEVTSAGLFPYPQSRVLHPLHHSCLTP